MSNPESYNPSEHEIGADVPFRPFEDYDRLDPEIRPSNATLLEAVSDLKRPSEPTENYYNLLADVAKTHQKMRLDPSRFITEILEVEHFPALTIDGLGQNLIEFLAQKPEFKARIVELASSKEKMIDDLPDNSSYRIDSYRRLGNVYRTLNDTEALDRIWEKTIQIAEAAPSDAHALLALSEFYLDSGDTEQAKMILEKARPLTTLPKRIQIIRHFGTIKGFRYENNSNNTDSADTNTIIIFNKLAAKLKATLLPIPLIDESDVALIIATSGNNPDGYISQHFPFHRFFPNKASEYLELVDAYLIANQPENARELINFVKKELGHLVYRYPNSLALALCKLAKYEHDHETPEIIAKNMTDRDMKRIFSEDDDKRENSLRFRKPDEPVD